jgi:NAD(P)-dependent dehydrogenase (short-subunit alcohol dehydrogenase family)
MVLGPIAVLGCAWRPMTWSLPVRRFGVMTDTTTSHGERVAIITGASRGLGLALARDLAARGWQLVLDARGGESLGRAGAELGGRTTVVTITGDVADEDHRTRLVAEAARLGRLDLLVNNASMLGPSPQPALADYPLDELRRVYEVNVVAPLRLVQLALPLLEATGGRVVNVTSDAARERYAGWGGYGSSKAALEQVSNVLAAEHPALQVLWVDPGDMRTDLHQAAFPGEDISDRPPPEVSVPGLLALLGRDTPSGRYCIEKGSEDAAAPSELVVR